MRTFIFAWICLVLVSLTSCGQRNSSHRAPIIWDVGFDVTVQKAEDRVNAAAVTIPQMPDEGDGFVLRALDAKTTLIATAAPENEDAALAVLQDIKNRMVPVTDLAAYFDVLGDAYEKTKLKVVILVFTDSQDDHNPNEVAARISNAASRLAANPNVLGIILVGTIRETRPGWTGLPEMLGPLQSRVHVIPLADMNTDTILKQIEAAKGFAVHE